MSNQKIEALEIGLYEQYLEELEKRIEELETKEYERDLNERPKN